MAEYQPAVQEIQVADCDLENFSHPSHSIITSPGEPKPKSTDKHLPNGITRISPDNNGIINHGPDGGAAKTSNNYSNCQNIECLCDHARGPLDPSQQQENLCDSRKSSNQHIIELTSDLESLNIDKPSIEEKDILLGIEYVVYQSELQMPDIMRLITKDLSEPYSIYTYRYFIHNWPKLCFLAMDEEKCVGAIVCKLDMHKKMVRRGYIAMLAVDSEYRRKKIGSHLVLKAIKAMIADDCDEVVLETEITNQAALRLYENLGFVRDKRLFRYYLNGVDALRLKLWLR